MDSPPSPILFFDGHCGLCNRFVDFLLLRSRSTDLRFAPLQGPTARSLLPRGQTWPDCIVLLDSTGTHLRSDAALRAVSLLGGPWRGILMLRLVPRRLRDAAYDAVAARRTRWFGRSDACRVPTSAERGRLLP